MFLTTEPSLPDKSYIPLRVIFGVGTATESSNSTLKNNQAWSIAIGHALAALEKEGSELGAHGIIGVHLSTSQAGSFFYATVMGTAIKFQQP